ncbi:MAG TPA: GntG family PLP-dependent aldolase [Pirellulaceae bacterium]|nr:GntG family PLP-dependent aldolase [Pirellulaceae bacterium]
MTSIPPVDLRSDTLTLPTPAMRRAMIDAPLGDDVIDVDPTIDRLQAIMAERTGKEAAIFVPSGTMANQIALRVHCRPGDEFVCDDGCHILHYEQGAYAQLSGLAARPIIWPDSIPTVESLEHVVRPPSEHVVRTRLLALENTHNKGGGRVVPIEAIERCAAAAHQLGLATHLDGARLFNAVVASGIPLERWCAPFDTVSLCFSKGLGAPVGSVLVGSREMIAQARRHRKLFGGAMRQVGLLGAAALHALEHHVERLAEDHAHAARLADAIRQIPGLTLEPERVDTNIVIFRIDSPLGSSRQFVERLAFEGVRAMPFSHEHVRLVTYLGIDAPAIDRAIEGLRRAATI